MERIERHVKILRLGEEPSDGQYWLSRPASERFEAVEMLRRQYHGDDIQGIQPICQIINRQMG